MLQPINPKEITQNPFSLIGDQWMLITAGTTQCCNTMTASWGGVGVLWGVPMATVYIRPQRFTKEFIQREDFFTLSFLAEEYRKELTFCGKESGRNKDKIQECGFTVAGEGNAPYIGEAELVLVCKKRYVQSLDVDAIPADVKEKWYPQSDFHDLYFGEIVEAWQKG